MGGDSRNSNGYTSEDALGEKMNVCGGVVDESWKLDEGRMDTEEVRVMDGCRTRAMGG